MSDPKLFHEREKDVNNRAGRVLAFTSNAPINSAMSFDEQANVICQTAMKDPMFEGVAEGAVRQIATAWAAGVSDYRRSHGCNPPADLLANAHKACENLILESAPDHKRSGDGAAMLESASSDMRTSEGVMRQAIFMAMILPAALGAATSDMCTFMPVSRDESDFYEVYNVAGSKMGSFQRGDQMDHLSAGIFSQMGRIFMLKDQDSVDGTAKEFTIAIKEFEGRDMPVRRGRVRVIVNRRMGKYFDDSDGNINFNEKDAKGNSFTVTGNIDYTKGIVVLKFDVAPPAGTHIAMQAELDVESDPDLIPVINQAMRKWTMKPSQYILAAEHTVQAMMDLQREFGLSLASMQFTSLTQWCSHEQDMKRLRKLAFHTVHNYTYDTAMPQSQQWEQWCLLFRGKVTSISTDMRDRTKKYGIRGGFAGGDAAGYIKSLPLSMFQPAPNYVQTSYVHFIGMLFGTIRIYEVPKPICLQFDKEGYPFSINDILFYSRGENLSEAGIVAGDAVPAIPFTHPTTTALVNRQTLWGSAINEIHPRNGEDYFARLTLVNEKIGAIDPRSGNFIEKTPEAGAPAVPVESVSLVPKSVTATVGEKFKLSPTVLPENATNKVFTLTSSDEAVAVVDQSGEGEAKAVGVANVTMTSEDGTKTAVAKVTVKA
ncbi:TPA: Ig-like domain-containing protein [Serratia fonticola]